MPESASYRIYTLSLHDALPIYRRFNPLAWISLAVLVASGLTQMSASKNYQGLLRIANPWAAAGPDNFNWRSRSEEHTSELQSHSDLVCRHLLEKKNELI